MRPRFRRFLTAALLLIAALCAASALAGLMAPSLAIEACLGVTGILLALHGSKRMAGTRSSWRAPDVGHDRARWSR